MCCSHWVAPRGTYHLAGLLAIISIAAVPIAPPLGKEPDFRVGSRHQLEIYQGTIWWHDFHGVGLGFYHFDRSMTQVNLKQTGESMHMFRPANILLSDKITALGLSISVCKHA